MADINYEQFDVHIEPSDPLYVISIVSEMVNIPVWTLRKLDDMGIVCPRRLGKKTRCYSLIQVKVLGYIQYLMQDRGVNISGIKLILEIDEGKEEIYG